jgi:TonB family protein
MTLRMIAAGALSLVLIAPPRAAAQDSLAAARDLYASAAYDEALAALNQLKGAGRAGDDQRAIDQYRAFCLLALGRSAEAEEAIAAVVAAEPRYQPSAADVSPRVRAAFSEVRRRMLPGIIQRRYADAKNAFDRKDFAGASEMFQQVLDALNDPDVAAAAAQPPLSDIHTLALGFHDLAVNASAPPLPPPPPAAAVEAAPATAPPSEPQRDRIYTLADPNVIPPAIIRQWLPPFPGRTPVAVSGAALEVVIDETGSVQAAMMRIPVNGAYDSMAIAAARNWRFKPATVNGVPVKFRKIVQITFKTP